MATVTPVSEAEATAFQQQYQQVLESWLKDSLLRELWRLWQQSQSEQEQQSQSEQDKQSQSEQDKQSQSEQYEQFQSNSKVSIKDGNNLIYDSEKQVSQADPELLGQLAVMKNTPVGETVRGASDKTVEVDGQVVLQTDEKGKVVANNLNEIEQSVGGLEVAQRGVTKLEPSPLVDLLQETLQEMKALREQNAEHQEAIKKLVEERQSQPKHLNWWQQSHEKVVQAVSQWQEIEQNQKAAQMLKQLYHQQVKPGQSTYNGEGYTITRLGRSYRVEDTKGNQLLKFRAMPFSINIEEVNLSEENRQDLAQLREQLSLGESPQGNFAPVGEAEGKYFERVQQINEKLTQYAIAQKDKVEIHGQSYRWSATPSGDIRIDALDERGPILLKVGGEVQSRLNQRDLAHFEQVLAIEPRQLAEPSLVKAAQVAPKGKGKGESDLSL